MVRLITFIAGAGITILLYSFNPWVMLGFIILFLIGFVRFVKWHQAIQQEKEHTLALVKINENEIKSLDGNPEAFENGKEFINPSHPYSVDLDIFGSFSLFHFVNRTTTSIGKVRLAGLLTSPVDRETILGRQAAFRELAARLDWRQDFQAIGSKTKDQLRDVENLRAWLNDDYLILNNRRLKAALVWVPIVMTIAIGLAVFGLPISALILFLLIPAYFLKNTLEAVNQIHEKTGKAEKVLKHYTRLIRQIEDESFDASVIKDLKVRLIHEGKPVSQLMKRLSRIISQLNVRYNAFAIVLNLLFLWDLRYVLQLEKWKAEMKDHLPGWFDVLAEFDAFISMSTLVYNKPDWVLPEITESKSAFYAGGGIGHPLLAGDVRVTNDLDIPGKGHMKLITGSNMAGKSTFLRSIGLSIAMAMIGSPVCARSLRVSPMSVYSSMRTQDDLHESTSSFYAELKRLKFILEAVERGEPVFFLLDEILKGTNSHDRHSGAKALILQLIRRKGNGLIATHDLELGYLEQEYSENIENLCFEVEVEGEELHFDYKIKNGLSQSLNATILMKRMGIEV